MPASRKTSNMTPPQDRGGTPPPPGVQSTHNGLPELCQPRMPAAPSAVRCAVIGSGWNNTIFDCCVLHTPPPPLPAVDASLSLEYSTDSWASSRRTSTTPQPLPVAAAAAAAPAGSHETLKLHCPTVAPADGSPGRRGDYCLAALPFAVLKSMIADDMRVLSDGDIEARVQVVTTFERPSPPSSPSGPVSPSQSPTAVGSDGGDANSERAASGPKFEVDTALSVDDVAQLDTPRAAIVVSAPFSHKHSGSTTAYAAAIVLHVDARYTTYWLRRSAWLVAHLRSFLDVVVRTLQSVTAPRGALNKLRHLARPLMSTVTVPLADKRTRPASALLIDAAHRIAVALTTPPAGLRVHPSLAALQFHTPTLPMLPSMCSVTAAANLVARMSVAGSTSSVDSAAADRPKSPVSAASSTNTPVACPLDAVSDHPVLRASASLISRRIADYPKWLGALRHLHAAAPALLAELLTAAFALSHPDAWALPSQAQRLDAATSDEDSAPASSGDDAEDAAVALLASPATTATPATRPPRWPAAWLAEQRAVVQYTRDAAPVPLAAARSALHALGATGNFFALEGKAAAALGASTSSAESTPVRAARATSPAGAPSPATTPETTPTKAPPSAEGAAAMPTPELLPNQRAAPPQIVIFAADPAIGLHAMTVAALFFRPDSHAAAVHATTWGGRPPRAAATADAAADEGFACAATPATVVGTSAPVQWVQSNTVSAEVLDALCQGPPRRVALVTAARRAKVTYHDPLANSGASPPRLNPTAATPRVRTPQMTPAASPGVASSSASSTHSASGGGSNAAAAATSHHVDIATLCAYTAPSVGFVPSSLMSLGLLCVGIEPLAASKHVTSVIATALRGPTASPTLRNPPTLPLCDAVALTDPLAQIDAARFDLRPRLARLRRLLARYLQPDRAGFDGVCSQQAVSAPSFDRNGYVAVQSARALDAGSIERQRGATTGGSTARVVSASNMGGEFGLAFAPHAASHHRGVSAHVQHHHSRTSSYHAMDSSTQSTTSTSPQLQRSGSVTIEHANAPGSGASAEQRRASIAQRIVTEFSHGDALVAALALKDEPVLWAYRAATAAAPATGSRAVPHLRL